MFAKFRSIFSKQEQVTSTNIVAPLISSIITWGENGDGQLGQGNCSKLDRSTPKIVPIYNEGIDYSNSVRSIQCGISHTVAIVSSLQGHGKVFSWGSGYHLQLGLSSAKLFANSDESLFPDRITDLDNYNNSKITAGYFHTTVLTDKGKLFSWGNNSYGQLGVGNLQNFGGPQKLRSMESEIIEKISNGALHSVALTSKTSKSPNVVFVWGCNTNGQLGQPLSKAQILLPLKLELDFKVKEIQCGAFHTTLVSEEGDVYCMGSGKLDIQPNNPYNLHKELKAPSSIKPLEKVLSGAKIKKIACGNNTNLALSEDGKLFGWDCSRKEIFELDKKALGYDEGKSIQVLLCNDSRFGLISNKGEFAEFSLVGNTFEKLDNPNTLKSRTLPPIEGLNNVVDGTFGWNFSALLQKK